LENCRNEFFSASFTYPVGRDTWLDFLALLPAEALVPHLDIIDYTSFSNAEEGLVVPSCRI
jgi:hypothetical protein